MVLQFRVADNTAPLGYRTVDVTVENPLPVTGAGGGQTIPDERLVPEGGTTGQVLKAGADGPEWGADKDTTYTAMTATVAQNGVSTAANTISAKVMADEIERRIAAATAPLIARIEALEAGGGA